MEYDDDAISRMFASPIACIFPYSYNFYTTVELCKHIEIKLIKTNDSKVLEVTSNKVVLFRCSAVARRWESLLLVGLFGNDFHSLS